jgi:hypothetical protein
MHFLIICVFIVYFVNELIIKKQGWSNHGGRDQFGKGEGGEWEGIVERER